MSRGMRLRGVGFGMAAVLVLGGCKAGSDSGGSVSTTSKSGKKYKVGVSIPAADHGWTAGVKYWAKVATEQNPDIEWTIQTPRNQGSRFRAWRI